MTIDPSLIHRAAAAAAGHQQQRPGTLYVVATPIGNLADMSLRAIHVLMQVSVLACEDTRVTGQLLALLGLQRPSLSLLALHAHNEQAATQSVLQHLAAGQSVACVSDAGTPAISDPGAVVVAAAAAAGHPVVPVPGASSALAALSAAGDTQGTAFCFSGFLPARGAERRDALAAVLRDSRTQVLFEAPHRIEGLVRDLADSAPRRCVTLARELTKQFESIVTLDASALPDWLQADSNRSRGEFVLVLHALPPPVRNAEEGLPEPALRTLRVLLRDLPLKQAVALAAELSGAPRKALYRQALVDRPGAPEEDPD